VTWIPPLGRSGCNGTP